MRTLADLKLGESGTVKKFNSDPIVKRNCMMQGMIKGSQVTYSAKNPFGDPRVYTVNSTKISLRIAEAETILL